MYHICYEWADGWLHHGRSYFFWEPDTSIDNYTPAEVKDVVLSLAWEQVNEDTDPEDHNKGTIVITSMSKL